MTSTLSFFPVLTLEQMSPGHPRMGHRNFAQCKLFLLNVEFPFLGEVKEREWGWNFQSNAWEGAVVSCWSGLVAASAGVTTAATASASSHGSWKLRAVPMGAGSKAAACTLQAFSWEPSPVQELLSLFPFRRQHGGWRPILVTEHCC